MNEIIPQLVQIAQHQQGHNIGGPLCKMDILFYSAIKKSRNSYNLRIILHLIKLILLCVFLPIDILNLGSNRTIIIVFLGIAIGLVCLNLLITLAIIKYGYQNNPKNNQMFMKMAQIYQHSVAEQPYDMSNNFDQIQRCVSSTIYNAGSGALNSDEGLTNQIRNRYQSIYTGLIQNQVLSKKQCLAFLQKNGKFGSLAVIIFGIIALSLGNPSSAEIGVIITYLVLQALNIWIVLLLIILLALSPILICMLCVFCCCCAKQVGEVNAPGSVEATAQIIEKTDGSCAICFQNFKLSQKVIILRCSDKHVFHQGCISGWFRVSQTCPMCRKNVNQTVPL